MTIHRVELEALAIREYSLRSQPIDMQPSSRWPSLGWVHPPKIWTTITLPDTRSTGERHLTQHRQCTAEVTARVVLGGWRAPRAEPNAVVRISSTRPCPPTGRPMASRVQWRCATALTRALIGLPHGSRRRRA
jgi:hypothetical protein